MSFTPLQLNYVFPSLTGACFVLKCLLTNSRSDIRPNVIQTTNANGRFLPSVAKLAVVKSSMTFYLWVSCHCQDWRAHFCQTKATESKGLHKFGGTTYSE